MDKPMDETDRKHCLLDIHAVREASDPEKAVSAFFAKWINHLESVLAETPEDDRDDDSETVKELEAENDQLQNEANALREAATSARDRFNVLAEEIGSVLLTIENIGRDVERGANNLSEAL